LSVPNTPTGLTATGASGCSGGLCTIVLQWNEVTRDSTNYIAINTYILHRQIWKLGSLESESDLPAVTVTPGTTPTFSDAGLDQKDMFGSFYQYRYTVKASQCSGTNESAFSSEVIWPCANFTVDPPASGVLSGSGAAGDPYLITSPSGLFTVNGSLPISAVVATYTNLTTSATTAMPATPIGAVPTTTWTLNLPLSANDGTRYRIDVTVTDAANGCTTSNSPGTFAEDAPSSCCLEPYKLASAGNPIFNNAVLTLDSVNNTVNVKLVNDCDVDLTITNVDIDFTRDLGAQSGRLKLKKVVFNSPAGTGNQDFGGTAQAPAVSLPGTAALPTSPANGLIIRSVLANRTYIIDLQFQNRAVTLADILQVCITYTNPSATTFQCRIAPQASANANCNP
jgi:hypothetical protein